MDRTVASFKIDGTVAEPISKSIAPQTPDSLTSAFSKTIGKDVRYKPAYTDCWLSPEEPDSDTLETYRTRCCSVSINRLKSGETEYRASPFEYSYPHELNEIVLDIIQEVRDAHRYGDIGIDRDSIKGLTRSIISDRMDEIENILPNSDTELLIADICDIVYRYSVGAGVFDILLTDPHIEDVYVDAPCDSSPIHVTLNGISGLNSHIRCRTNLTAERKEVSNLIHILKRSSGLRFSQSNPVMETDFPEFDARATVIGYPMSPEGDAVAIRKHSVRPWTLSRMVYSGSLDPKAAGILSFLVDNRCTILICGPRGAGKTSMLSSLMMENRVETRQLVIEDTAELNCEQMRRIGYKVQSILVDDKIGGDQQARMDEALKVSLRMGESSIVLGEVRGEEAKTLYQSMRAGRAGSSVMGTIHGDSAKSAYLRVTTDMGVTPDAFMATDVVITLSTVRDRRNGRLIRRVDEMVCTGSKPGEFIDISDIQKLTSAPLFTRILRVAQIGKQDAAKEIAARGMMRLILAEAGKEDERYMGPEWILAANEILEKNISGNSAEQVTAILRNRINKKERSYVRI